MVRTAPPAGEVTDWHGRNPRRKDSSAASHAVHTSFSSTTSSVTEYEKEKKTKGGWLLSCISCCFLPMKPPTDRQKGTGIIPSHAAVLQLDYYCVRLLIINL
jgi:hypothetical protein